MSQKEQNQRFKRRNLKIDEDREATRFDSAFRDPHHCTSRSCASWPRVHPGPTANPRSADSLDSHMHDSLRVQLAVHGTRTAAVKNLPQKFTR